MNLMSIHSSTFVPETAKAEPALPGRQSAGWIRRLGGVEALAGRRAP
jgi:hypothetical protein